VTSLGIDTSQITALTYRVYDNAGGIDYGHTVTTEGFRARSAGGGTKRGYTMVNSSDAIVTQLYYDDTDTTILESYNTTANREVRLVAGNSGTGTTGSPGGVIRLRANYTTGPGSNAILTVTSNATSQHIRLLNAGLALTASDPGLVPAGVIELSEISAPAAPGANNARLYARDNGAGKTQIVAVFNTGAVQVIATQP
jgi:hypothetical protein